MPDNYVRIALSEEEFARLLEILGKQEDPVVYKLRAKALSHQASKLKKDAARTRPAKKVASR